MKSLEEREEGVVSEDAEEIKRRVEFAFVALRNKGYWAEQNFQCCQSCALAVMPKGTPKYVYYHSQDNEDLLARGELYLGWGTTRQHGKEIVAELVIAGLRAVWDGRSEHRIFVALGERRVMAEQ